jgi:hypothetical protein
MCEDIYKIECFNEPIDNEKECPTVRKKSTYSSNHPETPHIADKKKREEIVTRNAKTMFELFKD